MNLSTREVIVSQLKNSKSDLQRLLAELKVTEFLSHAEMLASLYAKAKGAIAHYSYLRFAADLGFGETNVMRLVVSGQRVLTVKAGRRIAHALDLHGTDLRYWNTLVAYAATHETQERERLFRLLVSYKSKSSSVELTAVHAEYFSEWYHPIIREMVGLSDFEPNAEWIQQRLAFPLRLEFIRKSLSLLQKLGVLTLNSETQKWERNGNIATAREVDSLSLVSYHQKMIAMGAESMTRIEEQRRDIQAITVSLPASAVTLLKARIEEWTTYLLALEKSNEGASDAEIHQINIQVFPFTKKG
jgi:uncharacterized protein (TIGR02147 family)